MQHSDRSVFTRIRYTAGTCGHCCHGPADHFEELLEMVPIGSGTSWRMESVFRPHDLERPSR
jgi:hypothetical protein